MHILLVCKASTRKVAVSDFAVAIAMEIRFAKRQVQDFRAVLSLSSGSVVVSAMGWEGETRRVSKDFFLRLEASCVACCFADFVHGL